MLKLGRIDPTNDMIPIIVIGIGGTGSHLIENLVAINETMLKIGYKGIRVIAFDGDKVSLANIGRQAFKPNDYDNFKCVALIERINQEHGFSWVGIPMMFDGNSINLLRSETKVLDSPAIVISCVDKVKARREIATVISSNSSHTTGWNFFVDIWMDIGNEKDFGQIIVGAKAQKIPDVFEVFPNMEDHEDNDTPSCSIFEALTKQSLFINKFMATFAADMLKELLTEMYLPYSQLYFNLKEHNISTQ